MSLIARPYRLPRMSSPVITARTPGSAFASVVSIRTMRAWGRLLCSTLPQMMPGSAWSAAYSARPVVLSTPSTRAVAVPTVWYAVTL